MRVNQRKTLCVSRRRNTDKSLSAAKRLALLQPFDHTVTSARHNSAAVPELHTLWRYFLPVPTQPPLFPRNHLWHSALCYALV
jgi:hypothetical protein